MGKLRRQCFLIAHLRLIFFIEKVFLMKRKKEFSLFLRWVLTRMVFCSENSWGTFNVKLLWIIWVKRCHRWLAMSHESYISKKVGNAWNTVIFTIGKQLVRKMIYFLYFSFQRHFEYSYFIDALPDNLQ